VEGGEGERSVVSVEEGDADNLGDLQDDEGGQERIFHPSEGEEGWGVCLWEISWVLLRYHARAVLTG
jgi:hypothetical protein